MIQAAEFPIGLILIVITGADLFTGNTMVLTVSTLHRKTTWINLLVSWSVSFFGNLAGCLFFLFCPY
jgi:formate/nitrite transporter FocA (FNT family)